MNSSLLNYWYCKKFGSGNISGGYISFNGIYIEQLPIVEASGKMKEDIIQYVKKILSLAEKNKSQNNSNLQSEISGYQKQINQIVYKLYDLTPAETKIIENE